jgi:membrane protein DedA with SNARE-associated domain
LTISRLYPKRLVIVKERSYRWRLNFGLRITHFGLTSRAAVSEIENGNRKSVMHHLVQIWFQWVEQWGYMGIILLMAMESSIFPVPSEIVIPPAAFLATQGKLNTFGVIAAGTFGSWFGATVTYWTSLWLGRVFIARWGRYFLISEHKLERAERWVRRYEAGGIFFARLLPVIRHLISIPAGIIRMNFATFSVMTLAGSALWCSVLTWFGQKVLTREMVESKDAAALIKAVKESGNFHMIVIAFLVVAVLYLLVVSLTDKERTD